MDRFGIKKNIGITFLMKPVSMLLTFLYTPMLLAFLGDTKYGIWAIIGNIIGWISYFDIGIGNGLKNKLAESYANDDKETAQIYISTGYIATALVSLIFCILILVVWNGFHLATFFNMSTGDWETDLVINISIVFVGINFVTGLVGTMLSAIQKNGYLSVVGVVIQAIIMLVLWVGSHFTSENLLFFALLNGLAAFVTNIAVTIVVMKRIPYFRPRRSCVRMDYIRPLMTLGIGFFIMQISSMVLNTTDNLLISKLFGAADVTPYSMVYRVFYILVQVHAMVIMPMWPAYTAANAQGDIGWIKNTMKRVNLITILMTAGGIAGIFLFEPFARIWLGKSLVYGKPLIIITAIYMIAQMWANNYSAFLCGVGYINISIVISVIGAVINIPASVLFAVNCKMGLAGIISGSLLVMSMSVVTLPIVTAVWFKKKEKGEI